MNHKAGQPNSALAWMMLWAWGYSPYGGYIHNHAHAAHGPTITDNQLALFALFVIGWTLMTVAMINHWSEEWSLALVEPFNKPSEEGFHGISLNPIRICASYS